MRHGPLRADRQAEKFLLGQLRDGPVAVQQLREKGSTGRHRLPL